jgi:hypothetical protein
MRRITAVAIGGLGLVLGGAAAYSIRQRRETEEVPHVVLETVEGVELRQYPAAVAVETEAPSDGEAFGRLFRYISGANEGGSEVQMTAPVSSGDGRGESIPMTAPVEVESGNRNGSIPMTAPVETSDGSDGVRMAFYLPPEYDLDSAPTPTDSTVELVVVPERTLAVRRFSWRPTDRRVARETGQLLETLERADVPTSGEPFYMGYDAPWTLPFLRRNEVAVEVESVPGRARRAR